MPFCPVCRSEYVEGIRKCSDCGVELVEVLPEEEHGDPDLELVEVFETYGEVNAQLVRTLLESYGVDCFLQGEAIRYIHGFTLTKLGKVRVLVRAEDKEEAQKILEESRSTSECPECGCSVGPFDETCPLCNRPLDRGESE